MQKKRLPLLVLSFLVPLFIALNYNLNHFYVRGGYMLDSGWFAYLASHSTQWPPNNPPVIGGTYFSIHFSPVFYVLSGLYQLLDAGGLTLDSPVWFSLCQAFWFGLLSLAAFVLLTGRTTIDQGTWVFFACIVAIVVPFNGVSLALIGFPHFEIAIPALLMAFFAAHFSGHTRTAYAVLLLGLSIREDTGLHYFGSFLVLAASLRWSRQNEKAKSDSTLFLRFAIICLLYSLAAIAIQKTLFPTDDDALRRVYLGNPIYSHINYEFLRERAQFFFSNRLYIIIPLILLFVIALVKRNALLAVGGVSVLPWIFFSVLGISPWAGTLASYYGFPIVTGVLWPVICSQLELCYRQSGLIATSNGNDRLVFTAVVVALSIVFFPGSKGNHDATPWKDFIPRWIGKIDGTRNALELFFNDNSEIARFVV